MILDSNTEIFSTHFFCMAELPEVKVDHGPFFPGRWSDYRTHRKNGDWSFFSPGDSGDSRGYPMTWPVAIWISQWWGKSPCYFFWGWPCSEETHGHQHFCWLNPKMGLFCCDHSGRHQGTGMVGVQVVGVWPDPKPGVEWQTDLDVCCFFGID
jgi:hypothetical protein